MASFPLAIFLSAFLLFQLQPVTARLILPWYGGTPALWTARPEAQHPAHSLD